MAKHLLRGNLHEYWTGLLLLLRRWVRRTTFAIQKKRGWRMPAALAQPRSFKRFRLPFRLSRRLLVQVVTATILVMLGVMVVSFPLETGRFAVTVLRSGWETGVDAARWVQKELYPSLVFSFHANDDVPSQLLEAGLPNTAWDETAQFDILAMTKQLVTTMTSVDLGEVESILEAQFLGSEFELPAYMTERAPDPTTVPLETKPIVEIVQEIEHGDRPVVAIYHTHSSEAYHGRHQHTKGEEFFAGDYCWGQDTGVISVGDELAMVLAEEYKIPVVHSRTIHDYPVFRDAYTNSRLTLENMLREYPSIQIVLDVHRDGLTKPPEEAIATTVAGEGLARVAIVVGKGRQGFTNPHWEENQRLAIRLHEVMERLYPGLSRGIVIKDWPYNQELHSQAILLEIGDHYNTRAEAIKSARLVADSLAMLLK